MSIVEKKMNNISPRYLSQYEQMIRRYSQFGGGAEEMKYEKGRSFSNVYEFYMFAFFIGLYRNEPIELSEDDKLRTFWEIKNWQPSKLVDSLIVCALARSDFDMIQIEYMQESDIAIEISKLRNTIERYANGGFKYIEEQINSNPDQADRDDFFIRLLKTEI